MEFQCHSYWILQWFLFSLQIDQGHSNHGVLPSKTEERTVLENPLMDSSCFTDCNPPREKSKKGAEMNHLYRIQDGAVVVENGKILTVGKTDEIFKNSSPAQADIVMDASGKCLLPGFIDSHTHLIFDGFRPKEFLDRLDGKPYLEIMKEGGGIQHTVERTRAASAQTLTVSTLDWLAHMSEQGVTCVEAKSGYGLDLENEMKLLSVIASCSKRQPVELVPTYLGAHAVPLECQGRTDDYVSFMIENVLPAVRLQCLAEFCDVFCENSVFSVEQSRRLLTAAKQMGFLCKLHADEMTTLGGAELACALHAISADHLLSVSDQGIHTLAQSDTVATLLPCTAFSMKKPFAPARKLINAGCAVSLASDFNPGSYFTYSVPLMIALAVLQMNMTLNETITVLTLNAAAAVHRADKLGSIEPGK